ncbi:hypothetical protein R1flu_014843 [Riccia fluitans]|uniref:Uncharacterized protein n=1 Tax=Riccia fluitans TaxID=41844 RepID=A0ABD1YL14_9MARC
MAAAHVLQRKSSVPLLVNTSSNRSTDASGRTASAFYLYTASSGQRVGERSFIQRKCSCPDLPSPGFKTGGLKPISEEGTCREWVFVAKLEANQAMRTHSKMSRESESDREPAAEAGR